MNKGGERGKKVRRIKGFGSAEEGRGDINAQKRGNEMDKAMRVSIGIVCVSVLVLCTGAVPAGFGNQERKV